MVTLGGLISKGLLVIGLHLWVVLLPSVDATGTDYMGPADDFYNYTTPPGWKRDPSSPASDGAEQTGRNVRTSFFEDDATAYMRCKATHRCPWARVDYDVEAVNYTFAQKAFHIGRWDDAALFTNFEGWKGGTHGWRHHAELGALSLNVSGGHFDSLALPRLGALHLLQGHVHIDTDAATMTVSGSGESNLTETSTVHHVEQLVDVTTGSSVIAGEVRRTKPSAVTPVAGTAVAVFNFASVHVGAAVTLSVEGSRALAVLSRSSIVFDTTLELTPGTLGGFPATTLPKQDNICGPGSGNVRVYTTTVTTSATDLDEVQTVTTSAAPGQQLRGGFTLTLPLCPDGDEASAECDASVYTTALIPHDASAATVRAALEDLPNIAVTNPAPHGVPRGVRVEQSAGTEDGGYVWTVTFVSAAGNVPQLVPRNHLSAIGAQVEVVTLQHGTNLGGSFVLGLPSDGGAEHTTRAIRYDVSAADLEDILEQDIPPVLHASVARVDPLDLAACDAGMCTNGPLSSYGYTWIVTTTTHADNVSPTSTTHPDMNRTGHVRNMTAYSSLTVP